jgi:type IV fimbrial biogenesis protein FimT
MDSQKGWRRRYRGFTLIEMLVALAILAILAAVAAPGLASIQQNAARRTALNDFWHAIFLARSEAIKRNAVVAICRSADGEHCDNAATDWSQGWIVFDNLDHDEPAQRDVDEPLIHAFSSSPSVHITSNRKTFSFRPATQGVVNGTIVFCDASGHGAEAIIISHTGRPRQSTRDASNKPLKCPD